MYDYDYNYDYVILFINYIQGYFIGEVGYNENDTKYTKNTDLVYCLREIWLNIGYEDNQEPKEFIILFEYLIRHCKKNNCKMLQLKIDKNRRYQLFYDYVKEKFNMEEYANYLIKQIQ